LAKKNERRTGDSREALKGYHMPILSLFHRQRGNSSSRSNGDKGWEANRELTMEKSRRKKKEEGRVYLRLTEQETDDRQLLDSGPWKLRLTVVPERTSPLREDTTAKGTRTITKEGRDDKGGGGGRNS